MITPEQRERTEERMRRYREKHPEEAARIDALFVPINDEIDRMKQALEDHRQTLEENHWVNDAVLKSR